LFVGRLTQIKRPDRLLDTVLELKQRNVDVKFIIAGDGDLTNSVAARVSKENLPVLMLGWQRDTSVAFSSDTVSSFLVTCSNSSDHSES
jgi:glycosyltransferase involved in cell wall biosynthesis